MRGNTTLDKTWHVGGGLYENCFAKKWFLFCMGHLQKYGVLVWEMVRMHFAPFIDVHNTYSVLWGELEPFALMRGDN